ncbi:MAG: STAS domain-containing protein [candidate division Zixibacteria bacterium]|nr:STAS domain-containing protein [candidate division Zixibacteria bacterium]
MGNKPISQKKLNDFTLVINPGSVLDNNNAHEMVEIITVAQDKGFKNIILDMTDLEFISSAGVGSILGTIETSREAGGDIILCNAAESILHVLEVLDLADYLTVKNNLEEAASLCS